MAVLLTKHVHYLSPMHILRREQSGRSMTLVSAGLRRTVAGGARQAGLRAANRLDITRFIYRPHVGVRRWIQIQVHDIVGLLGKAPVIAQLERSHPVRLQTADP